MSLESNEPSTSETCCYEYDEASRGTYKRASTLDSSGLAEMLNSKVASFMQQAVLPALPVYE